MQRLSIFQNGFTREAAEQVAGASLSMLSALVAKSLVRHSEGGRYDLHELIRQYANCRLLTEPDELAATHERHFTFYLGLAESAEAELTGQNQSLWMQKLDKESGNFRVALKWALARDGSEGELALRLAGSLHPFWIVRGKYCEGHDWMLKALEQKPLARTMVRARALARLSSLAYMRGDSGVAVSSAKESVSIFRKLGDAQGLAEALLALGSAQIRVEGFVGHVALEEALKHYREIGDCWGKARAMLELGGYMARLDDPMEGGPWSRKAWLSSALLGKDSRWVARLTISERPPSLRVITNRLSPVSIKACLPRDR
jgi:hypothetical protein